MKKLLTLLLTSFLLLLNVSSIRAESEHIYFGDDGIYLSAEEKMILEEDLENIRQEFDLDIYLDYDKNIRDEDIVEYAHQAIENLGRAENNIILVANENYYVFAATGPYAELINDNQENRAALWQAFAGAPTWFDAVRDYYQKVVAIYNAEIYHSDVPETKDGMLVNDLSGNLSSAELKELNEMFEEISAKHNISIAALLTDDLNGMNVRNYADDFYDANGYKDDGILLLVSLAERDWYVSTKGKVLEYLNDYDVDGIMESVLTYLSDGKYTVAFKSFAEITDSYYTAAKQRAENPTPSPLPEAKHFGLNNILIAAAGGAIVSLIVAASLKGQLKSVKKEYYAHKYIEDDSFRLNGRADHFVRSSISQTPRPKDIDRSSHSGGGGSSFHTSSSGSSHGGHGGKF